MLGTLGKDNVHSFPLGSCCCFDTSVFSPFAAFRLDKRDSAPGRLSVDLGAPTCFTEVAGIAGEPLLGGTGGLEDE